MGERANEAKLNFELGWAMAAKLKDQMCIFSSCPLEFQAFNRVIHSVIRVIDLRGQLYQSNKILN